MSELKPYQKELMDKLSGKDFVFLNGGGNTGKTQWIKEIIKEIEAQEVNDD